jgi:hypothetical protein
LQLGLSSFQPASVEGSSKYGKEGKCTEKLLTRFNLSDSAKKVLTNAGNYGLARSTWSSYGTAERLLAMCSKQTSRKMEFPLSEGDILEFTGWLMYERKVKAGTINSYLSGLRQLHILKGMDPPQLRTNTVNLVLRGKKNMDNIESRRDGKVKRLPMTMTVMRLLKATIKAWDAPLIDKLLYWSVSTMAFHGAFRIHEILCRLETSFDPDFALLTENVSLRNVRENEGGRVLEVTLKCPKESKVGKAVTVEIFETKGSLCPVKAFERWKDRTNTVVGLPLFRDMSGIPLTGTKLNKWLRVRLQDHIDYSKGKFTSHSFRSGLATTMGSMGYTEDDIKEAGRWSSKAYEVYMKLPVVKRALVARKLGKDL